MSIQCDMAENSLGSSCCSTESNLVEKGEGSRVGVRGSKEEKEEIVCRICHCQEPTSELITPCKCKGTMQHVHQSCLQTWLTRLIEECKRIPKCEICGYKYQVTYLKRHSNPLRFFFSQEAPISVKREVQALLLTVFYILLIISFRSLHSLSYTAFGYGILLIFATIAYRYVRDAQEIIRNNQHNMPDIHFFITSFPHFLFFYSFLGLTTSYLCVLALWLFSDQPFSQFSYQATDGSRFSWRADELPITNGSYALMIASNLMTIFGERLKVLWNKISNFTKRIFLVLVAAIANNELPLLMADMQRSLLTTAESMKSLIILATFYVNCLFFWICESFAVKYYSYFIITITYIILLKNRKIYSITQPGSQNSVETTLNRETIINNGLNSEAQEQQPAERIEPSLVEPQQRLGNTSEQQSPRTRLRFLLASLEFVMVTVGLCCYTVLHFNGFYGKHDIQEYYQWLSYKSGVSLPESFDGIKFNRVMSSFMSPFVLLTLPSPFLLHKLLEQNAFALMNAMMVLCIHIAGLITLILGYLAERLISYGLILVRFIRNDFSSWKEMQLQQLREMSQTECRRVLTEFQSFLERQEHAISELRRVVEREESPIPEVGMFSAHLDGMFAQAKVLKERYTKIFYEQSTFSKWILLKYMFSSTSPSWIKVSRLAVLFSVLVICFHLTSSWLSALSYVIYLVVLLLSFIDCRSNDQLVVSVLAATHVSLLLLGYIVTFGVWCLYWYPMLFNAGETMRESWVSWRPTNEKLVLGYLFYVFLLLLGLVAYVVWLYWRRYKVWSATGECIFVLSNPSMVPSDLNDSSRTTELLSAT